jgi:NAD(P)-dependent dehydrogenase (short-subunit alcohol dehydrogenase family)
MGVSADEIDRHEVDKQIGETVEIADITQFLASEASSFIVGETVTAKGTPDILEQP